ncbi:MAG: hypothetical protein HZB38_06505, partial [Planctomycetes bacterium]|nr:hypothetical protein [Planctomycetota bacterium]
RAWWKEQLRDPLRWLDPKKQLAKDSHSATVAIVTLPHPDGEVRGIVKRPIARDPQRALRRLFPPSRSWRGWTIGHGLLHRDLPAARPLAILERKRGPFVRDNLLLTEFVPDAQPLDEYLRAQARIRRPHDWFAAKRELIRIVVRELRRLQDRGFLHRDCKASNILIASGLTPRLVWIDMDGIRPDRRRNEQDRLRPLMRLHVSLAELPEITRTDRARFLKAYCARFGARTDEWRRCWRVLAELSTRKLEQRERRREWKREHYGRE